ncbi:MAG: alkaline phosphatase family protein [Dermatophilaceae bacterium]
MSRSESRAAGDEHRGDGHPFLPIRAHPAGLQPSTPTSRPHPSLTSPWTDGSSCAQCDAHDIPMDTFAADVAAGRLPNAGVVIPNTCNDAHDSDCTTGDADAWMRQQVGPVLAGTRLHSGNLAVVITANEDDASQDNTILTALIHPSQRSHVVTTP